MLPARNTDDLCAAAGEGTCVDAGRVETRVLEDVAGTRMGAREERPGCAGNLGWGGSYEHSPTYRNTLLRAACVLSAVVVAGAEAGGTWGAHIRRLGRRHRRLRRDVGWCSAVRVHGRGVDHDRTGWLNELIHTLQTMT